MKRTAVLALLLLAGSAHAQGNAPKGNAPSPAPAAAPAPSGNAPAANAPAANTPAANAPAANAPAANAPAANAPAASTKSISIRVPSGADYTAYIQEAGSLKTIRDKGDLDIPAGVKSFTVYVLDKSGYAAKKTLEAEKAPAELGFAAPDFKLLQKVRVQVTGKDNKPIAQGIVSLTDGQKSSTQKTINSASAGVAEFDFVASGSGSITVAPAGGGSTTKEVSIDLPKGEPIQTIPIALPDVTATVDTPTSPAAPTGTTPAPGATSPAPTQVAPAPAPAPAPQQLPPPNSGGGWASTLIGFIFLAAIIGGIYLYMKNKGITAEMLMKKMGVQPDAVVAGGGTLAGANYAGAVPAPGPPPPPPPVVADPNMCQFCGQMKDAAGNCACTVTPGSGAAPAAGFGGGFGAPAGGANGGPRLVGMQGTYMGSVFPVMGQAILGREPTNNVPLDRDTTASRRHAQITDEGGAYRIQDLGSSNGTFVNGARVTDAILNPGDEVSIGGTRFRFEV